MWHRMRHLVLLAALLALPALPGLASAQAVGVLGDPTGEAATPEGYRYPTAPASRVPAPPGAAPAYVPMDLERPPASRPLTPPALGFGQSFGHAWMGFGIGTGVGAVVGGLASEASCDDDWGCGGAFMLGAAIGAPVTAPLGAAVSVWAWGEARGAGGNFFASLGGAYLGGGLGFGLSMLLAQSNDFFWTMTAVWLGPVVGSVLANLGAAAGYHLSRGERQDVDGAPAALVVPTLAPTGDGRGGTIGVVGAF